MLARLKIVEADKNRVIKLSEIDSHATGVIPPVPNPTQGDRADVYAGGKSIAQVPLNLSGETRFPIPKSVLLDFAGIIVTSFYYTAEDQFGNSEESEKEDFVIKH
ncbi:hypothetical protein [Pseudomonas sp. GM25]|uniref:hypothetical protein n=1 Tax=Pseudomonas sp. GM25 TaxID=1144327 RepID=UPI0002705756|nr:hypothetical protein [Pseudomonas sp. GM25]EJM32638.1 hypothetical protein PMI24_00140 [Pseudomonas sp. GM25]